MGFAPTSRSVDAVIFQRRRLIGRVPEPMRRRGLYLPVPINNRVLLRIARARRAGASDVTEGVLHDQVEVPDSSATLLTYQARERDRPSAALIWIHGGGFISGAAAPSNDFCSELARDLGLFVVNVDYRLAPEQPFPAGFDDCYAALIWLHHNADRLGIDPARIVVAGASAGAGLAAAVAQRAYDEQVPLAFQALVYPMLDDRTVNRRGLSWLTWSPSSNRFAWRAYLGQRPGRGVPPAYSVAARRADLSGLAPAWMGVGDIDLFHDEVVAYAERLRAAGVDCALDVIPGMYHGADASAPDVAEMQAFRARVIQVIRDAAR